MKEYRNKNKEKNKKNIIKIIERIKYQAKKLLFSYPVV